MEMLFEMPPFYLIVTFVSRGSAGVFLSDDLLGVKIWGVGQFI